MKKLLKLTLLLITITGAYFLYNSFSNNAIPPESVDRLSKIPNNIRKITPETDIYPPILHSNEFKDPVSVPGPINTAGAEDSPFITPDGNTFYF